MSSSKTKTTKADDRILVPGNNSSQLLTLDNAKWFQSKLHRDIVLLEVLVLNIAILSVRSIGIGIGNTIFGQYWYWY